MKRATLCVLCNYKNRLSLESKILTGEVSMSEAGRQIGASYQSVKRHMKNHVTKETHDIVDSLVPDLINTSITSVFNAEQELTSLIEKAKNLIEVAEKEKDYRLMLLSMEHARKCIETAGKLFAELIKPQQDNTVKVEIEFI